MFDFNLPYAVVLLLVPFIVRRFLSVSSEHKQSALIFPAWIEKNQPEHHQKRNHSKLAQLLLWLMYASLVVALMQPMWVGDPIRIQDNGRDLLLAVDLSGSMKQEDFVVDGRTTNRFVATQKIVSEFIEQRKGDRVGMIMFGDHAYLQSPLSFDLKTVNQFLQEAFIGMAGQKTAIGEAIGLAIKKLTDINNPQKVLILITDGTNTSGTDPIEASEIAAQENIVIHTIGVGADEVIVRGFFGRQRVNPSRDLDEVTLKKIAQITGGQYFRARDTQELKNIYNQLDALNPVKRDKLTFRPESALFYWPLMAMLFFAMVAKWVSTRT